MSSPGVSGLSELGDLERSLESRIAESSNCLCGSFWTLPGEWAVLIMDAVIYPMDKDEQETNKRKGVNFPSVEFTACSIQESKQTPALFNLLLQIIILPTALATWADLSSIYFFVMYKLYLGFYQYSINLAIACLLAVLIVESV